MTEGARVAWVPAFAGMTEGATVGRLVVRAQLSKASQPTSSPEVCEYHSLLLQE